MRREDRERKVKEGTRKNMVKKWELREKEEEKKKNQKKKKRRNRS